MADLAHRGKRKPGASGYKGGCRCPACRQGQRDKIARQRLRGTQLSVTVDIAVTAEIAVAPADQCIAVAPEVPDRWRAVEMVRRHNKRGLASGELMILETRLTVGVIARRPGDPSFVSYADGPRWS